MTIYQSLPAITFAAGFILAWTLFRERLQRLRCERNLAQYRADRNRSERDQALARVAQLTDGGTYLPNWIDRREAARLNHPAGKRIPKQGER